MKISLATNFDDALIDKIKAYNIYEVYGKLNVDIIGGGRPSNYLNELHIKNFEKHVKKVRDTGINFNYLLNSACLENLNQNINWVKNVVKFLEYLKSVGVNALTVTNPYLLELIKKYFKNDFIIRVSSFACVDNYEKAKFWQEFGADIICVDFCKLNRNFKMLEYMVKNLHCKLELLCTNSCLKDCAMIHTHVNDIAHASNSMSKRQPYEDWGLNFCQEYQLNNLHEYIKSPWIRPEDIKVYESIGIQHFKITERDFPTEELVKRVKVYTERSFDGNLLDLIQCSGAYIKGNLNLKKRNDFSARSEVVDEIKRVRGIGRAREAERHIFIDNKKIPQNFINFFVQDGCSGMCDKCNYCKRIANNAIIKNEEVIDYLNFLYSTFNKLKY
ncbi:MAG TPA: U32 family peptidase [Candidatus Caccopulliclostridium gallistercoris]|uniref:U32 family peptidase n=1 Tax=Candidatus Caccopulliclostridium gallistercoris TaxID=2840719 RepID=A0A9D1NER3_9FIRM|nr:U32 family peptidase [Candidatus Caccopulliclostridium gallistercoris]